MKRLDAELVERQWVNSRAHAQRLIKGGRVVQNLAGQWQALLKPSIKVDATTELKILPGDDDRYVSRGGLKLEGALAHSGIGVEGLVAIDVGQSTGGFSDCLLQAGIARVVGVDVGHDQLAQKIKSDHRVTYYEGINARQLPASLLDDHAPAGFDLAVMDVSFISQTLILPSLSVLIKSRGQLLSLVKPQFEVGPEGIGKGGLVKDEQSYRQVQEKIERACANCQLVVKDFFDSPIKGGDGNREFFIWAEKSN